MKNRTLTLIIILATFSLVGVVTTQIFWLNRSVKISEKQFDDRVDRMMTDIKQEIKVSVDTSSKIKAIPLQDLQILEMIDTNLLRDLFRKYVSFHRLGSNYHYALIRNCDVLVICKSPGFSPVMEPESYMTCMSFVWKKDYMHLSVFFPDKKKNIYLQMKSWIILSLIFILIITGAFIYIVFGLFRQKKLSEVKNDFINNMTHEFKTPISTISLASEMLIKTAQIQSVPKTEKYARIIFDENKRMQTQIELILQTAASDRQLIKLTKESVDIHELIKSSVQNFCVENCEKEVKISFNLLASNPNLTIDPVHIRNVIGNIVDNAIKYSGETTKIAVATRNLENAIELAITDNGIGIPKESVKKIFDKFYRVSKGNVHNVKGFGLGLYYVKSIIDAHHGNISVVSNMNNGSTFFVLLPQ
jgi:two-component system, OmpR family, phosphate regulon sensor histidine kinase PhoR